MLNEYEKYENVTEKNDETRMTDEDIKKIKLLMSMYKDKLPSKYRTLPPKTIYKQAGYKYLLFIDKAIKKDNEERKAQPKTPTFV